MLRRLIVLLTLATVAAPLAAKRSTEEETAQPDIPRRVYETVRIADVPPTVDGHLDDSVWDLVEWSGDFIQRDPADGEPPTQSTEFKVVYDDEALYFAFRLHDDPQKIDRMLARRDGFPGDWIEVNIDSYSDRRTAFSFTLSCSGTRGDELISNDGDNWNSSWNPVWNGATQVDEEPITSKWWFWTGVGVVVAGALVGIVAASSGAEETTDDPSLLDDNTRTVGL